jgi:hypothetical protein
LEFLMSVVQTTVEKKTRWDALRRLRGRASVLSICTALLAPSSCTSTEGGSAPSSSSSNSSSATGAGGSGNGGSGGEAGSGGAPQPLAHDWSFSFGGDDYQVSTALVLDSEGEILVAGYYRGTMQVGPETLVSTGIGANAFLVRLSADGDVLWARSDGATGTYPTIEVRDVALDAAGNIYSCGIFSGSLDFGRPSEPLEATAENHSFAVSLTPGGVTRWAATFTTASHISYNHCTGIAATSERAFLVGSYDNEIDFGGGTVNAQGDSDLYIVALHSATGVYEDALSLGGDGDALPADVVTNGSDIYVVGDYFGEGELGGDPLPNAGASDIFIASYDSDLVHHYSHGFGDAGTDRAFDVTLHDGTLAVAGAIDNPDDLGDYNALVAWFSASDGEELGSMAGGDASDQHATGAAFAPDGTLWAAGSFSGELDWNGSVVSVAGEYDVDIFVARVSDDLVAQYGDELAQPSEGVVPVGHPRLAIAPDGGIVVTGEFTGSIDFGGRTLEGELSEKDWFIAKLRAPDR